MSAHVQPSESMQEEEEEGELLIGNQPPAVPRMRSRQVSRRDSPESDADGAEQEEQEDEEDEDQARHITESPPPPHPHASVDSDSHAARHDGTDEADDLNTSNSQTHSNDEELEEEQEREKRGDTDLDASPSSPRRTFATHTDPTAAAAAAASSSSAAAVSRSFKPLTSSTNVGVTTASALVFRDRSAVQTAAQSRERRTVILKNLTVKSVSVETLRTICLQLAGEVEDVNLPDKFGRMVAFVRFVNEESVAKLCAELHDKHHPRLSLGLLVVRPTTEGKSQSKSKSHRPTQTRRSSGGGSGEERGGFRRHEPKDSSWENRQNTHKSSNIHRDGEADERRSQPPQFEQPQQRKEHRASGERDDASSGAAPSSRTNRAEEGRGGGGGSRGRSRGYGYHHEAGRREDDDDARDVHGGGNSSRALSSGRRDSDREVVLRFTRNADNADPGIRDRNRNHNSSHDESPRRHHRDSERSARVAATSPGASSSSHRHRHHKGDSHHKRRRSSRSRSRSSRSHRRSSRSRSRSGTRTRDHAIVQARGGRDGSSPHVKTTLKLLVSPVKRSHHAADATTVMLNPTGFGPLSTDELRLIQAHRSIISRVPTNTSFMQPSQTTQHHPHPHHHQQQVEYVTVDGSYAGGANRHMAYDRAMVPQQMHHQYRQQY